MDDVERDPETARRLMRSYARNQGSQASAGTILADLKAHEGDTVNENTVYSYIKALKKIFVIEDSLAWNPNLRSKTAVRTSDTRYFTDPSIATAALGLGPEDLLNDLNTFGLLFETLCIRDLRVYAEAIGGKIYHYRDKNNLECDAVIHLKNGRYGLVEIKLGGHDLIEEGAATLSALANKIDTVKMPAPAFMMILTGTGQYAYKRPKDGILVVPVGWHYGQMVAGAAMPHRSVIRAARLDSQEFAVLLQEHGMGIYLHDGAFQSPAHEKMVYQFPSAVVLQAPLPSFTQVKSQIDQTGTGSEGQCRRRIRSVIEVSCDYNERPLSAKTVP